MALHFATSADIVEALIMSGSDVDHENSEGKTPGRLALDRQNIAVVRALISSRADLSRFHEPRKDTDSSKRVSSGSISEEDTGLMQPPRGTRARW
jgi:ankyrin repeat protein